MQQNLRQTTPTQRVVTRLASEGWVDCQDLGLPALSQYPISDLRTFILTQLQQSGGWMRKIDLQLAALIFSIPAHEFQFHPQLRFVLKRLEAEDVVEVRPLDGATSPGRKPEMAIVLKTQSVARWG